MSRLWREQGETKGTHRRPRAALAWCVFSLACAAAVSVISPGCLVINQYDFEIPDRPPTLSAATPLPFATVPFVDSSECVGSAEPSFAFHAVVTEPDPEADVWGRLFINRKPQGSGPIKILAGSAPMERVFPPQCVPKTAFELKCNLVQLVVSHDYAIPYGMTAPADVANPTFSSVLWWVLPPVNDDPDSSPSDCAQRVEVDAGIVLPRPDAGSARTDGGT